MIYPTVATGLHVPTLPPVFVNGELAADHDIETIEVEHTYIDTPTRIHRGPVIATC